MARLLLAFFILTSFSQVQAQKLENIKVDIIEGKANISYDLSFVNFDQKCEVALYCVVDDYPLRAYRATGDIGENVLGGQQKTITWRNDKELTTYDIRKMKFEVKVFDIQDASEDISTEAITTLE